MVTNACEFLTKLDNQFAEFLVNPLRMLRILTNALANACERLSKTSCSNGWNRLRSVVDLGIRLRTNATNIGPQEAVIGIHQCQQHDGKETLVVEVRRSGMRGFLDGNVLAVKGTASVGHIPASLELFSDGFPLIFGHSLQNSFIKELINDGMAHLWQKHADAVVSDMEAVRQVNI